MVVSEGISIRKEVLSNCAWFNSVDYFSGWNIHLKSTFNQRFYTVKCEKGKILIEGKGCHLKRL